MNPSRAATPARGLLAALGAFGIWGLLPAYLHPLNVIGPLQIISHRIAWSCVFVLAALWVRGELGQLLPALRRPALLGLLAASAGLISVNWVLYVWAVGHGHVIEGSLGYYINPLVNVLLGVLILRERLSVVRWLSVALAALAVLWLSMAVGRPPWIALILAASFSLYGLLRKLAGIDALPGLAVETLLLLPAGLGYLIWTEVQGLGAFGHGRPGLDALLVGCGPVTAVPLFLFAYAARALPYSTVGLLQYLAPTLQLVCGLWYYHEPFDGTRAVGFGLIWLALGLLAVDSIRLARRSPPAVA